jgi:ABC-type multidrug transport system fused ATPase/permease subunit
MTTFSKAASSTATADSTAARFSLKDLGRVVAHSKSALALVRSVDRTLLRALLVGRVLEALSFVAVTYVSKLVIDSIARHQTLWQVCRWVALEFALAVTIALLIQGNSYAQLILRAKLGLHVNLLLLDKCARVAYGRFEDPKFVNLLNQARREASSRPLDLVNQCLTLARQTVLLTGLAALLSVLGPWALAMIVLTSVPPFVAEARFARQAFLLQKARAMRNRKSFYLESVLSTEQTVKEVKLFQLAGWLREKYREILQSFQDEEKALAERRGFWTFALGLVGSIALYGSYAFVVSRALAGAITIGATMMYMAAFRQAQDALHGALSAVARAYEHDLYMSNLSEFLAEPEDEPDGAEPLTGDEIVDQTAPSLVLRDVSFRYPGTDRDVLSKVNLTIAPGETIALVGKNGAGKTTLIKLLVGLFKPTSGQILVNNEDVTTLSMSALRRRVGVIFQDFARLQLTMRENVGVGWLPEKDNDQAVSEAVKDGGADSLVERLKDGIDTPLGRAFGGDDLSGGQWQRVALARAFMRKSKILILDEPTASMDAEAEHEIFQRFGELKKDRTAILITHRFGTVRMADRIVVIDGGQIVEDGTHEQLMKLQGQYAHMFSLQAAALKLDT